MNITDSLRNLSNQHLVEQNLITKGLDAIKQSFNEHQQSQLDNDLERSGAAALEKGNRSSDVQAVRKAIDVEAAYRRSYQDASTFSHDMNDPAWTAAQDDWYRKTFNGKEFSSVMKFASPALQDNKELALYATQKLGSSELPHLSPRLQDDRQVAISASLCRSQYLTHDQNIRFSIDHFSQRMRDDSQVALNAETLEAPHDRSVVGALSPRLRNDKTFALAALEINGSALQHFSEGIRNDKECVLTAVRHADVFDQASPSIRALVGNADPEQILERAVSYEKLQSRLESGLAKKDVQKTLVKI